MQYATIHTDNREEHHGLTSPSGVTYALPLKAMMGVESQDGGPGGWLGVESQDGGPGGWLGVGKNKSEHPLEDLIHK